MLKIGCALRNIVPPRPCMLHGQMHVRIAKSAINPLQTTALAIEGKRPDGSPDCAIMVSVDVAYISVPMQDEVRRLLKTSLPAVPGDKVFLTATHTHTSMVYEYGSYPVPTEPPDLMQPPEVFAFLTGRIAEAAVMAWEARAESKVARGFGHAVIAHNRRPVYANGEAEMYGPANRKDFRWIEGPEDHSVDLLFVWGAAGNLAGVVVDVPCPAQVVENLNELHADFWHDVRCEFAARFGAGVWVMPMCGASGDQSPHFIFDSKQEAEMRARRGVTECQEIAQRIADAVQRAIACTQPMTGDVVVAHDVRRVDLPPRKITKRDRDWSLAERENALKHMDPALWWPTRLLGIVEIFDGKRVPDRVPVELHALRIGDGVIITSPFELFTDFGLQIKARSVAAQTFTSQLTAGSGLYLPTDRGAEAGGYGSIPVVSTVGPDGGQELVEHSLDAIASLFAK